MLFFTAGCLFGETITNKQASKRKREKSSASRSSLERSSDRMMSPSLSPVHSSKDVHHGSSSSVSASASATLLGETSSSSSALSARSTDNNVPLIDGISVASGSVGSSSDKSKKKKARTTFTGRQIFELEKQFEIKKYLSSSERSEMAKLLNVTETQVNI